MDTQPCAPLIETLESFSKDLVAMKIINELPFGGFPTQNELMSAKREKAPDDF